MSTMHSKVSAALMTQNLSTSNFVLLAGCHGDSAVLRLVQGLVALCQRPQECGGNVNDEVGRCLGEVGPVDFKCIALSSDTQQSELWLAGWQLLVYTVL